MRLIVPNETEKRRWDELVSSQNGLIFSQSWYMDATGYSWLLILNDDFSGGMVCPFVVKMGQKILVTPFFVRCVEWIGKDANLTELLDVLHQHFSVAELQVVLQGIDSTKKHQFITKEYYRLGSQAKRSLKKADIFTIDWELKLECLQDLIQAELKDKIQGLNTFSLTKLNQIVGVAQDKHLHQINCWDGENFKGGLWLLEDDSRVIYLKGSSDLMGKKQGVMYRLMNEAIQYTLEKNKIFDFGGSNVESVAHFNYNFGARDAFYGQLIWNNAPWWWNFMRNFKNKWKRK